MISRIERDEFLRGVVAELKETNARWPGLWTRLEDLMAENAALRAQLGEIREITNSELDWTSPTAAGDRALFRTLPEHETAPRAY